MENQLKDEQIRNQAETIQSLERKVESLEKELEKFLDPDSGKINPSLKGEKALLARVQVLQSQLDECLEVAPDGIQIRPTVKDSTRLNYLIASLVGGLFMPFPKDNPFTKKAEDQHKVHLWDRLIYIFANHSEFDVFWSQKPFRVVMSNLVSVCGMLEKARVHEYQDDSLASAGEYFCSGVTEEEHQGTILLKDAIHRLYALPASRFKDMDEEEIDELYFSIQIMIQCQRLSMVMRKNEEQPQK